jgi:hypothetical protein
MHVEVDGRADGWRRLHGGPGTCEIGPDRACPDVQVRHGDDRVLISLYAATKRELLALEATERARWEP